MVYNFSAGPAVLPPVVIQEVKNEFDDFCGTGSSIIEISHRSPEFLSTIGNATIALKSLLRIPDNYEILFMQGGATAQFSAVIYNLLCDKNQQIDYLITGAWSQKAYDESKRLGVDGNVVFTTKSSGHTGQIPPISEMKFSSDPAFIYYCKFIRFLVTLMW
jgi:phosphoserine aminotransferase